jgi:hypothetical protein
VGEVGVGLLGVVALVEEVTVVKLVGVLEIVVVDVPVVINNVKVGDVGVEE